MKKILSLALLLALATPAAAQFGGVQPTNPTLFQVAGVLQTPQPTTVNFSTGLAGSLSNRVLTITATGSAGSQNTSSPLIGSGSIGAPITFDPAIALWAARSFKLLGTDATHYAQLSIDGANSVATLGVTSIAALEVATSTGTNITIGVNTGTGLTLINGGTVVINVGQNGGGDVNCAGCGPGGIALGLLGFYGTTDTPWLEIGKDSRVRPFMLGLWNGPFTMDGKGDSTGHDPGGTHIFSCAPSTGTSTDGCDIQIVPGPASAPAGNGGALTLNAGAPDGGAKGLLNLGTSSTNTGTIQEGNASSTTLMNGGVKIVDAIISNVSGQTDIRATVAGTLIARFDSSTNKGATLWSADGSTAQFNVDTTVGIKSNYNGHIATLDNTGYHILTPTNITDATASDVLLDVIGTSNVHLITAQNAAGSTVKLTSASGNGTLTVDETTGVKAAFSTTSLVVDGNTITVSPSLAGVSSHIFYTTSAPSIASGFGTGASVTAHNGTAAFRVGVGTSSGSSGIITMPAATTGWNCNCSDITTQSSTVYLCKQIASATNSATIANYDVLGALQNWVDSDVLAVSCFAF